MLSAAYLLLGTIALMIGAISWGFALRHRRITKRNRALAALERFDSGRPNVTGLLRATRGLAIPAAGAVASPVDPTEHAVWIRYVLEELSDGWNEVFSEARPAQFRLSIGSETAVTVKAVLPKTVLLREGTSSMLGELFDGGSDGESPEELSLCSPEFAEKVEAERASREALFRVRVERILEGESVYVAGVVSETGDSLRLDGAKAGTMIATVPETELTARHNLVLDLVLGVVGFFLLGSGFWMLRLWSRS